MMQAQSVGAVIGREKNTALQLLAREVRAVRPSDAEMADHHLQLIAQTRQLDA
jgi:hypothetical protein